MKWIRSRDNFISEEARIGDVIFKKQAEKITSIWGKQWLGLEEVDATPDIGTASTDLIYSFQFGNKAGGITMPNYDISTALIWTDPYFFGTVQETVTAQNITNADILGLDKLIVPEQSNEINYDVSANYQKIKFVYAFPASYGDIISIFDVKNDFNVTSSFDSTTINVKMSGLSGPGPYVSYKVYIKSHWISFTPDVSIFKLDFNI